MGRKRLYFRRKGPRGIDEGMGGYPGMADAMLMGGKPSETSSVVGMRYEILGMSHDLEMKSSEPDGSVVIGRGMEVCGKDADDGSDRRGRVLQVHRATDYQIDYVLILDAATSTSRRLDPSTIEYVNNSRVDPHSLRRSNPMDVVG